MLARLERHADGLSFAAFAVYALAVGYPSLGLPYFWDAAPNVIEPAHAMLASHFASIVPNHPYFAHPPLFHVVLALAWTLVGESRAVAHLVLLPFLPLAMAATYAIGRRMGGRLIGLAAAFVFATMPLVVAEAGQVYIELPMVALATAGLAAWLAGRRGAASALFCAAALVKVPGLLVPASLAAWTVLRPETRKDVRAYAALLAPLGVVVLWGAYHAEKTGWWLVSPAEQARYGARSLGAVLAHARVVSEVLFLDARRWLLVAFALAGAAVLVRRRATVSPVCAPLALVLVALVVFYALGNEFLARYVLLGLPAFVLLALYAVSEAFRRSTVTGALAACAVVAFGALWHPQVPSTSGFELEPPEDLSYRDILQIGRESSAWLEAKHPDAAIFGGFHESYMLTQPFQGYVTRPLHFTPCTAFSPDRATEQLVVIHGYAPEQRTCQRIVQSVPSKALKRFTAHGKWIEIHRLLVSDTEP